MNKNISNIICCSVIGISIIISSFLIVNAFKKDTNEVSLVSIKEVANILGMSVQDFEDDNLIDVLSIPHINIKGKILFEESLFKEWFINQSENKLKIYDNNDQLYIKTGY